MADGDSVGTTPKAAGRPKQKNGESGIRTHGGVAPTHDFQSCSLSHSDISPRAKAYAPWRIHKATTTLPCRQFENNFPPVPIAFHEGNQCDGISGKPLVSPALMAAAFHRMPVLTLTGVPNPCMYMCPSPRIACAEPALAPRRNH